MHSGGPFGRQEYTLKHSVMQPIIIIIVIVSLLTRVHKLSVNLFLSSCFFGARTVSWTDGDPKAFNRFFHFYLPIGWSLPVTELYAASAISAKHQAHQ